MKQVNLKTFNNKFVGLEHLVCGNYLAWGRVTIYYSQFYLVSCLLRLRGFALTHLDFVDDGSSLVISFEKLRDKPHYFINTCKSSGHEMVWTNFAKFYPELGHEDLGKYFIKERNDWNYDLFCFPNYK